MKQVILLSIVLLLLASFVAGADPLQDLEQKAKEADALSKKLANPNRADYLKEAWADYLNTSKAGTYVREADRQLRSLDFAWKFLLGMPFSWSFHFLLAFVFWIALGTWIYRLLTFLELWDHKLHLILAFIGSTLVSVIGIDRELTGFIAGLVLKIPVFWYQLLAELAILIGIGYLATVTKVWANLFESLKKSRKENKLEQDVAELKEDKTERDFEKKLRKEHGLDKED